MKITLLALFAIISGISSYARIGDTYEQSVKRYGKPLNYFKDKHAEVGLFGLDYFVILVRYRNGVAFEETYRLLSWLSVQSRLSRKKSFKYNLKTCNTSENLSEIPEKHRQRIMRTNLNTEWTRSSSSGNLPYKYYSANLGNKSMRAVYYPESKLLVVSDDDISRYPKASFKEIKYIKSVCAPLKSTIQTFLSKWGSPVYFDTGSCYFLKDDLLLEATFGISVDNNSNLVPSNHKYYQGIINYKEPKDETSGRIVYAIIDDKILKKYMSEIENAKKIYFGIRNRKTINKKEKKILFKSSLFLYDIAKPQALVSMKPEVIMAFLESTTGQAWKKDSRDSLDEVAYLPATNNRLFAFYNIIGKKLYIYAKPHPRYNKEMLDRIDKKFREDEAYKTLDKF